MARLADGTERKWLSGHATSFKDGDAPGSFSAIICLFDTPDLDQEIVRPSLFTDGQHIPIASYGHDWATWPIGDGIVRVLPDAAVVEGQLWLDTPQGQAAYPSLKRAGDLQQWSFGFTVTNEATVAIEGKQYRELLSADVHEASPVFLGAQPLTRTLSVKAAGAQRTKDLTVEAPEDSWEDIAEDIAEAFSEQFAAGAYCTTVATYVGYAYVMVCDAGDMEPTYYRVDYTLDAAFTPTVSNPQAVEAHAVFTPIDAGEEAGGMPAVTMKAARRALRTLAAVNRRGRRRVKEGRPISNQRRARLGDILAALRDATDEIDALLKETEPPPREADKAASAALLAQYAALAARVGG